MKKSMKTENILIIDSDYEEASGFIKGLEEVTCQCWKVHENNKIYGIKRYIKFFTVALGTVFSSSHYEGKMVLCWQQFYGIAIAFFSRLFHVKKRYKLIIMTFIYKPKKGIIGKFVGFAPMICLFVGYLIIPLVFIGLSSMGSAFAGLQ